MAAKKKKTAKRRPKPKKAPKKKKKRSAKGKCDPKWLCKWLREGVPAAMIPAFAADVGYNYNNPPAANDAWLAHANWFFNELVLAIKNLEAQVVYTGPKPPAQPPYFYAPGGGGTPPPPPPTYPPN